MDILNRAVVFACDFKQYSVAGKTYIKNYGKAGGAPEWLQCGDGTTTTTFPTPLARFGATFDGGDYINTGVVDRYERTNQFSLYHFGSRRGNCTIISTITSPTNQGVSIQMVGSNPALSINAAAGGNLLVGLPTVDVAHVLSLTYTYSGTTTSAGVTALVNGSAKTITVYSANHSS